MTRICLKFFICCLIFFGIICSLLKVGYKSPEKTSEKNPKINFCPNFDPGNSKFKNSIIAIVIIIAAEEEYSDNMIAINTTECYAKHFGYQMHQIYVEKNIRIQQNCKQIDHYFLRHCVLATFLEDNKDTIEYALIIDADTGVINPCHTIQEYIDSKESVQMTFYERYYDHEIATGSYLVKNTQMARNLLMNLSNFKLPENDHANDKAALHQLLMELHFTDDKSKMQCYELYKKLNTNDDLYEFEVCTKNALLSNSTLLANNTIKIIRKMTPGWVRDGWLAETKWSSQDFMFHGWKISKLAWEWNLPFTKTFDMNQCRFRDFSFPNFKHKSNFISTAKEIQNFLQLKTDQVHKRYTEILCKLNVKNHKVCL